MTVATWSETLAPLSADLARLDTRLTDGTGIDYPVLRQVLDTMFKGRGKRIRPALVLAAVRVGSPRPEASLDLAAAVETLHTATLVHDDTVDRSDERRGVPTLNSTWGPGAAVLAGDWLFARAASFATRTGSLRVMEIFARTLMTLTDGELRQLMGRQAVPDEAEYERRIYAKTAALFEAATEMAAVVARLPEESIQALAEYGRELGMGFQIADDILDFTGDPDKMGKPVGSDLRAGTATLPVLRHLARGDGAGSSVENDWQALALDVAADGAALGEAWDAARRRIERAVAALERVPPGEGREILARLARHAVDRDA